MRRPGVDPISRAERAAQRAKARASSYEDFEDFKEEMEANPVELRDILEPRQVGEHRNLDCPIYDQCLDKIAALDWSSFSCSACQHRETGVAERAEDSPRRLDLI